MEKINYIENNKKNIDTHCTMNYIEDKGVFKLLDNMNMINQYHFYEALKWDIYIFKSQEKRRIHQDMMSYIYNGMKINCFGKTYTIIPNTLVSLQTQFISNKEKIIFHADGEICKEYDKSDIGMIIIKCLKMTIDIAEIHSQLCDRIDKSYTISDIIKNNFYNEIEKLHDNDNESISFNSNANHIDGDTSIIDIIRDCCEHREKNSETI